MADITLQISRSDLIGLVQRTGTVIAFDRPASYGDVTAETGNITFDFTNAIS